MAYKISVFFQEDKDLTDEEVLKEIKTLTENISKAVVDSGYDNEIDNVESKPKSFVSITYLGSDMAAWVEQEINHSFMVVMPHKEIDNATD